MSPTERIPRYFDLRVLEKYIQQGELSRADYEAHLLTLPDESQGAVETETRMGHAGTDRAR